LSQGWKSEGEVDVESDELMENPRHGGKWNWKNGTSEEDKKLK